MCTELALNEHQRPWTLHPTPGCTHLHWAVIALGTCPILVAASRIHVPRDQQHSRVLVPTPNGTHPGLPALVRSSAAHKPLSGSTPQDAAMARALLTAAANAWYAARKWLVSNGLAASIRVAGGCCPCGVLEVDHGRPMHSMVQSASCTGKGSCCIPCSATCLAKYPSPWDLTDGLPAPQSAAVVSSHAASSTIEPGCRAGKACLQAPAFCLTPNHSKHLSPQPSLCKQPQTHENHDEVVQASGTQAVGQAGVFRACSQPPACCPGPAAHSHCLSPEPHISSPHHAAAIWIPMTTSHSPKLQKAHRLSGWQGVSTKSCLLPRPSWPQPLPPHTHKPP